MGDQVRAKNKCVKVTLTKPYYMGVFEVTQRQWELVLGDKPSFWNNLKYYATRPVEGVSYQMIRGSHSGLLWPIHDDVDSHSFLGVLRNKTNIAVDLPTESQWEYACRAGTCTDYNIGKNMRDERSYSDANMMIAGRFRASGGWNADGWGKLVWKPMTKPDYGCTPANGTAEVGSYRPNAWGLYDMHGNVWEWCLDGWNTVLETSIDPKGCVGSPRRVIRGGGWLDLAAECKSAYRTCARPEAMGDSNGFRLAIQPPFVPPKAAADAAQARGITPGGAGESGQGARESGARGRAK